MKLLKFILVIVLAQVFSLSCAKEASGVKQISISAFTVVNAIVNANPMIADFSGVDSVSAYYSTTPQIGYASFNEYSIPSGNVPTVIYQISDTSQPQFRGVLNLRPSSIYTLFLSGIVNSQNQADTLLTQDNPPYHAVSDSSVGVRFVNLSPGSNPISINIQGNVNGSEVSSLPYRKYTSFRNYPATVNIIQYIFEIRDAGSGSLLTTYVYNLEPFQNITIAVIGLEGSPTLASISATQVNNY